ncbi:MAG TPA: acetyl-CoA C-acetyltransferase [Nitrososphaerales archaeon]|nr:acetyl-CoA C-acetyltransferase [Nitrososphaerales archaeon]
MNTKEVVVVEGVRTPIGNFGGSLKDISVVQLGGKVIGEVLRKKGIRPLPPWGNVEYRPALLEKGTIELEKKYYNWDDSAKGVPIDEVIMGNVLQAGQGQNPARQATIVGGLPKEVNAYGVNKLCASGLKAITLGVQTIATGGADVIVAGGMESMSNVPYALPKARWGYRMDTNGKGEVYDLMVFDGLLESLYGYHMGMTAENIAEKYKISRHDQDELGLMSHERARAAIKEGVFKEEITPVSLPPKKGQQIVFDTDERPMDTSMEKMASLQPAFKKDGTVTAGNASGINDAAAAVLLMSQEAASANGLKPLARILGFASGAVDPAYMGLGPIPAIKKAIKTAGVSLDDIGLIELNEAFASQALACIRELGLSLDRTNVYGSGISLGHPIGCTGARVVVTLLHGMKRRGSKYGLASMCVGGGQGMAAIFELEA